VFRSRGGAAPEITRYVPVARSPQLSNEGTTTMDNQQLKGTFEGQVALVTGGSSGIGAAIALELAQAGARVVITGRHEETLRSSAARHAGIAYHVADAAQATDAARALDEIRARYGQLDALVNNAGVFELRTVGDAAPDHVRRLWDTNVLGVVETTRVALPLLKKSHGNIVNIASIVADHPMPNASVYSATKAAVLALTRAWARELANDGVRVNAVSPGPIDTPIFDPQKVGVTAEAMQQMGAQIQQSVPLKRFGLPAEVAKAVAFLLTPGASYITGAQLTVAGGMEA
jgi:NAD(P)-dependent dehydrogenase (short-subunit alcohol dehydrogenase family)